MARLKRTYAALHDVKNYSTSVIYQNVDDPCWYVFTEVVDVDTAIKVADALNREQRREGNAGS